MVLSLATTERRVRDVVAAISDELHLTTDEREETIPSGSTTLIPHQFDGAGSDKDLLPSLDRIDRDGHYENENLQVVCQFINFWKGDSDNEMFARLLMLVRGQDANNEDSVPNPVQHA